MKTLEAGLIPKDRVRKGRRQRIVLQIKAVGMIPLMGRRTAIIRWYSLYLLLS